MDQKYDNSPAPRNKASTNTTPASLRPESVTLADLWQLRGADVPPPKIIECFQLSRLIPGTPTPIGFEIAATPDNPYIAISDEGVNLTRSHPRLLNQLAQFGETASAFEREADRQSYLAPFLMLG